MEDVEKLVKERIRSIPNYPKKGTIFRDITPLLKDPEIFSACIKNIADAYKGKDIDYIAGIEARGFIIGAALAHEMKKGFIPIRKKGKLPYRKISESYALEYGNETIEMHEDALSPGKNVLIVDDLLATGGTTNAACALIRRLQGNIVGAAFIIELDDLNGRSRLKGIDIYSIAHYHESER
ncbi:MAG: adenine phosphoribosyltransferase [Candidatus Micrarchaeia archaeon]